MNIEINSISTKTIDNFSNFTLVNNSEYITSINLNHNLTFSYTGADSEWSDDYETYKLDFGFDNCTDFDVTIDLEYNTYTSYLGDFTIHMGTYYPFDNEYNSEGKSLCIGDTWITSGGIHHISAYPNNAYDTYRSSYGTLGATNGLATVHLQRFGSTLTCYVNESDSTIISHTWTTDVNQPVNYVLIHIYTGTTTPNFSIAAKNISGTFTIIEITKPNPFDVTNFSNFVLSNDCTNVQSLNDSSQVFFSFDGSTDESDQREDYIFDFKEQGNFTEFDIYTMLNYTTVDTNDRLTFRVFVGSYYDYSGNYLGMIDYDNVGDYLVTGAGIWDAWEANTGDYVVIGYPYNVKERIDTETLNYFGNIAVHLKRNFSLILTQCIDIDTGNILLEHVWDGSAGWAPANFILLDFYSEKTDSTVSTCVFNITGKIGGQLGYTLFSEVQDSVNIPSFTSITSITSLLLTTFFVLIIKKNKHRTGRKG